MLGDRLQLMNNGFWKSFALLVHRSIGEAAGDVREQISLIGGLGVRGDTFDSGDVIGIFMIGKDGGIGNETEVSSSYFDIGDGAASTDKQFFVGGISSWESMGEISVNLNMVAVDNEFPWLSVVGRGR